MASEVEERINKAFRTFDQDGDGVVERAEMERLLKALDPDVWTDDVLDAFMQAADSNDDGQISINDFVSWVHADTEGSAEMVEAGYNIGEQCPPGMTPCRYGAKCYSRQPDHLRKYWHPYREGPKANQRRACMYGSKCYRKQTAHLDGYAHPGDRNYRHGLVFFGRRPPGPEFETLWQVFTYFDPDESGQLALEEFQALIPTLIDSGHISDISVEQAWSDLGGENHGYANFARFAAWAESVGLMLPSGVEEAGSARPCNFTTGSAGGGGWRCGCAQYEAGENGFLCTCGHKPSAHRSQQAMRSHSQILEEEMEANWIPHQEGLVDVTDTPVLEMLQSMMDATTKKENNWTRDRGCQIHGRGHGDCSFPCIRENGWPVPSGYKLKKVLRNQNMELWTKFVMMRKAVQQEIQVNVDAAYEDIPVHFHSDLDSALEPHCNEWRLMHGTSWGACKGISETNFRLSLSGTGATWKEEGADKGSPLYGFGIYLAEMCTKSDEYAGVSDEHDGLNCMLVCRCVGGRSQLVDTNEIDKVKLKTDVFDGPFHSVFGDRVVKLGKPFREIVLYDKDQIYPEFVLLYERLFD